MIIDDILLMGALYTWKNGLTAQLLLNLASLVTIAGVIIAAVEYFERKRETRKQILISLKSQLDVISSWSAYKKGGYHKNDEQETIKDNDKQWRNPFYQVFTMADMGLQTIWLQPGVSILPKDIIENVARLNQEISNFNSFLGKINDFILSADPMESVVIHLKLNNLIKQPLNTREGAFTAKLVEMYAALHFDMIGDESSDRLYAKHKRLYELVEKELET